MIKKINSNIKSNKINKALTMIQKIKLHTITKNLLKKKQDHFPKNLHIKLESHRENSLKITILRNKILQEL